jgi:hypothetical protein
MVSVPSVRVFASGAFVADAAHGFFAKFFFKFFTGFVIGCVVSSAASR